MTISESPGTSSIFRLANAFTWQNAILDSPTMEDVDCLLFTVKVNAAKSSK